MYRIITITSLFCCLAACANVVQKDAPSARPRGVLEEDITDGARSPGTADRLQQNQSNMTGPQIPQAEGYVPANEAGAKSPRRIIWRDRKESDKKREPSADKPVK